MNTPENWSAPKVDALLAAFKIQDDTLDPQLPDQEASHSDSAAETLALWRAAQSFPNAALMVVKSDKATSLGVRNGGLIIEGNSKLNVGLMRASTRALAPMKEPFPDLPKSPSKDSFHRVFWSVFHRLNGTVLPRTFLFHMGGVEGQVYACDGRLHFAGDFLTPADFVAELKAACEVGEVVKYKLLADAQAPDTQGFEVSDLLAQVAQCADVTQTIFNQDAWLVQCHDGQSADAVCGLLVASSTPASWTAKQVS